MTNIQNDPRVEKMKEMRFKQLLTNTEIGNKFGISRERVRQLIGNTGTGFKSKRIKRFIEASPHLTNNEIIETLKVHRVTVSKYRNKQRHAIKGGNSKLAAQTEDYISSVLKKNEIKHKLMPNYHPFDILLNNGKKVDVKAASKNGLPPSMKLRKLNPYYKFNIKKHQDKILDFYILFIIPTNDIFIVPSYEVSSSINLVWPKCRKTTKWEKYHNRFDLLK